MSLEDSIYELAAAIRYFADKAFPPNKLPQPKPFTIRVISERRENDMNLLTHEADLPAVPPGTDVVSQIFGVTVDGVARPDVTLDASATVSPQFEVPQDSEVTVSLIYEDDATPPNLSPAKTQTFTARDTLAPSQPGDFGEIRVVGERVVPDA